MHQFSIVVVCYVTKLSVRYFLKNQRRTVHYHKSRKTSCRFNFSLSVIRSLKVDSQPSTLRNCRLPTSHDIAYNVRAAWRRRGVRYSSCGTQTFIFPLHFLKRYTPACVKPPVVLQAFVYLLNSIYR